MNWSFGTLRQPLILNPPFLRLDLVRAKFDLEGLINNQTVNALTLEGGSLVFGKSLREIFADPKTPEDPARASPSTDFVDLVPSISSESPFAWTTNDRK